MSLPFEIIINDSFLEYFDREEKSLYEKKKILSLINKFEGGQWWLKNFRRFINKYVHFATLSAKERNSLIRDGDYAELVEQAFQKIRLATDQDKNGKYRYPADGEIAEIFLYGLMQAHFKALPLVPKIFYKQNSQDNVKGADSVHILLRDDDFYICLGEAKFYSELGRFGAIIESVFDTFDDEKLRAENVYITNLKDLDLVINDEEKAETIKNFLSSNTSLDEIKKKLIVPILIMHECEITAQQSGLTDDYKEEIEEYHRERMEAYFDQQVGKQNELNTYNYEEIRFVLIVFPVPNKREIVDSFVRDVEHHQGIN